ncbi:hypothetical protein RRG08_057776 [Elysia crispata]|uniref:Secreted protein n=1 Tax=Elysia crispata TaxID=231223 RepID=A0AAE1B4S3_9GAST|nr:hypothetical protein RRG08_057776 [Elysia crispata]
MFLLSWFLSSRALCQVRGDGFYWFCLWRALCRVRAVPCVESRGDHFYWFCLAVPCVESEVMFLLVHLENRAVMWSEVMFSALVHCPSRAIQCRVRGDGFCWFLFSRAMCVESEPCHVSSQEVMFLLVLFSRAMCRVEEVMFLLVSVWLCRSPCVESEVMFLLVLSGICLCHVSSPEVMFSTWFCLAMPCVESEVMFLLVLSSFVPCVESESDVSTGSCLAVPCVGSQRWYVSTGSV